MGADTLAGNDVYNRKSEDLGDIKEIMLDMRTGRVSYAVLSFGGSVGMGEKLGWWRLVCHATVPNRAPTPAVNPMANAPQNVTRIAPFVTPAPPTRAASPPRIARNTSEVAETTGIRPGADTVAAANNGMAAPTAKLAAYVSAA